MQFKWILKFAARYIAASICATVILLMSAIPAPQSVAGWALLFALALPLTIIGEATALAIWRNPIARKIERQTAADSFSWSRFIYIFFAMLIIFGLSWGIQFFTLGK